MPDRIVFDLHSVTFAFPGRRPSISEAELRVLRGEHLALVGANGAGKSTLLWLMAALEFPTSGEILFEGTSLEPARLEHDSAFRRMFRRRVGFLFQNSDVQLFCPTVLDEVAFAPLQAFAHDEALDRTHRAMRELGVDALAADAPYALSGGEKRRVALAAVLAMSPDILLLDEPAANLDPRTRDTLYEVLEKYMADSSRTVILATHDLNAAQALAVNCAVITPEHRIALHASVDRVLGDEELLRQVNLVGERSRTPLQKAMGAAHNPTVPPPVGGGQKDG